MELWLWHQLKLTLNTPGSGDTLDYRSAATYMALVGTKLSLKILNNTSSFDNTASNSNSASYFSSSNYTHTGANQAVKNRMFQ